VGGNPPCLKSLIGDRKIPQPLISKGLLPFAPIWHDVCDTSHRSVHFSARKNAVPTTNPSSAGGFAIKVRRSTDGCCRWTLEETCNDDSSATVQIPVFPGDRCHRHRHPAWSLLSADWCGPQATG